MMSLGNLSMVPYNFSKFSRYHYLNFLGCRPFPSVAEASFQILLPSTLHVFHHGFNAMDSPKKTWKPQRSIDPVICTSCILVKQLVGGHVDVSKKLGWAPKMDGENNGKPY